MGLARIFLYAETEDDESVLDKKRVGRFDPTSNLAVLLVMMEKMKNRIKLLPDRQRNINVSLGSGFSTGKVHSGDSILLSPDGKIFGCNRKEHVGCPLKGDE